MFWRRRDDDSLREEIETHIAIETDGNIARGMPPEEARYAAIRKFGNAAPVQEQTRGVWIATWLDTLGADVRHALRRVRRYPGTAAIVVLSLALAFIPNVLVFSVLDHFFLTRTFVQDTERVLEVYLRDVRPETGFRYAQVAYPEYLDFQRSLTTVSGLAYNQRQLVLATLNGRVATLRSELVNDEYFRVLGIPLERGPGLTPNRRSVVISHQLWHREFGARPDILGHNLLLNGQAFVIDGVGPAGFRGVDGLVAKDLWMSIPSWIDAQPGFRNRLMSREQREGTLWVRVRPGVPAAQAASEIEKAGRDLSSQWPATNRNLLAATYNRVEELGRRNMVATSAGVLLLSILLAVACMNVAGVLLARAEERRHETAIRQSLGAPRSRLVREWMIECLLLASLAGMLGVAGARLLTSWLPSIPSPVPLQLEASTGPRVWTYAVLMVLAAALAFGLIPAWKASRPDLLSGLRKDAAVTIFRKRVPVRSLLVVVQIGAAQFLLLIAGLSGDTLHNLQRVSPGIDLERPVALAMIVPATATGALKETDYAAIQARLHTIPGVRNVAYGRNLPLSGVLGLSVKIDRPGRDPMDANRLSTGPGFLSLLGVRMIAGRDLSTSDANGVLVNRKLAEVLDGGAAAVGRQIRIDGGTAEVVGIFEDTPWGTVGEAARPRVIALTASRSYGDVVFAMEVAGDPEASLTAMRNALASAAPESLLLFTRTLRQHYSDALFLPRTGAQLLYALALLAVVLTITGLHGITTALFLRRSKEFAIRLAVGARPLHVVRSVVSSGCKLALAGLVLGLAAGLPLASIVAAQVHGLSAISVYTLGLSSAVITTAVATAVLQPALRVLRLQAADVLRMD